jgi:hypothetical protein
VSIAVNQQIAMTAVVDLEYWRPMTYFGHATFIPGRGLALAKP